VQDADDPLRVVRRLELNHVSALPSPGEREPIAFIAVGPASMAIHHILGAFGLEGRVPVLDLGCSNPMDDALLERRRYVTALINVVGPAIGGFMLVAAGIAAGVALS
jgi:hypothetical protein